MELNNKLTVSASPHVKSAETTTGIMLDVIIALIPAGIASIFVFGARALAVIAVAVICCVLAEFLSRKAMKREQTIGDLSAVVTGLLLAYNLPSNMPLWEVALGSVIAIVVVKQMFGGIGQNFVNPALLARIVLMSAFPARMSAGAFVGLNNTGWDVDGVTGATPMGLITLADGIKDGAPSLMQMFIGTTSGCLGEVSALALILGGIYLIIRRVINPIIPCAYIGTVAIITLIAFGDVNAMLYEILGGGLMIGAIFMATDYTTSPITNKGKLIYAICAGLLTCLIRLFGSLPEGVSFSIIIMNILTPLIENATKPTIFGTVKEKKNKEADA